MNSKKIFAALLVPALSATLFAGAASADYSYNASTGVRTWTFNTPSYSEHPSGGKYYLYSDTLSSEYSTEADAKAAQSDKDLLIYSTTSWLSEVGSGSISMQGKVLLTYLKAPCDGIVSVKGSSGITINDTVQTELKVSEGATVVFSSNSDYWMVEKIYSITFTPTSTQNFDVDTITIGNDTKDAGVTFTAANKDNWNCSIWDYVKAFRGNVKFDVKMNNVPADVTVSAESYVN